MGIENLSQLTPELQQAAAPLATPDAASMLGAPLPTGSMPMPAGQTPAPPAAGPGVAPPSLATPDASNGTPGSRVLGGEPLSFAEKIGRAADHLGIPKGPGGWAKSLVGAAQSALGGFQDAAADAATAAKEAIPGEGTFAALGHIRNAQIARQQAQQKSQTDEEKDRAMIAHENVQTLYQQKLLHQLDDKENHEDIDNGKAAIDNFTTHLSENGLQPAPIIAKDITEGQLQNAMKNQNFDPSYNHVWPTGSFQPFDPKTGKPMVDKDGQPVLQKTYTIVGNVPETKLSPAMAKLINDNVPGVHFENDQPLTGAQAGSLIQQAMNHQSVVRKIEADQEAADVAKMSLDQKKAQLTAVGNLGADYGRVLANANGDVELATKFMTGQGMMKGTDPKTGKPAMVPDPASVEMAKDHPQAFKNLMDAYGGAVEYSKIVNQQKKENEQARKDAEDERIKAQAEADKKLKDSEYQGDENATGPAFLQSLAPNDRSVVEAIGTGHVVADRLGYLLSKSPNLVAAVTKAYPDFDSSKAAGYGKMVASFTGGGKIGASLQSGATALNHLRQLWDLNTDTARIPGTAANERYNNKLDTLAGELGQFYGTNTQGDIESFKKTLGAVFNRGAAIQEQARSMASKLDNYRQQWEEGAPSSAYFPAMPDIRAEAKQDMAYVMSGGKGPDGKPAPPLKATAEPNVPHEVINVVNGKKVVIGYTTNGGRTMTLQPYPGARPIGTPISQ